MVRKLFVAAIFGGLFTQSAFSIGRIGNSTKIGDQLDGYSAVIPREFQGFSAVTDGGALLQSGLFAASPPQPVDINILSFRSQYPQLVGTGQKSIRNFFVNSTGAQYSQLTGTNGALNLFGETDSSYIGISVCGDGRGYVMFALKLGIVETAMKQIIEQTIFERPCSN
jgi:hypothetical protein